MSQKSVSLYKLTGDFREIEDLLQEGSEWTPEVEAKLKGLSLQIKEKIEKVLQFAQNLDSLADAATVEAKRLKDECITPRRKSAEQLRDYVLREMQALDIKKLELATFKPTRVLNSRPSIKPVDPEKIPKGYLEVVPATYKFSATLAQKHLEAAGLMPQERGEFEVEGLKITRKEHLRK